MELKKHSGNDQQIRSGMLFVIYNLNHEYSLFARRTSEWFHRRYLYS